MKRRIRIIIESERVLIIRRHRRLIQGWCERCAGMVELVTLAEMAELLQYDAGGLLHQSRVGEFHTVERSDGASLICLQSLLAGLSEPSAADGSTTL